MLESSYLDTPRRLRANRNWARQYAYNKEKTIAKVTVGALRRLDIPVVDMGSSDGTAEIGSR